MKPLADTLRPVTLNDYIGQEHIVGKNKIINQLINTSKDNGFFPSLILWGPPGTGKTTLARIIANELDRQFFEFSAVNAKSHDIQSILEHETTDQKKLFESPIVFLDEIHRFNKAQQDKLLPHVEKGIITLIGATTENPAFEVISALLSRTRVITLKQHTENNLQKFIDRALTNTKKIMDKETKQFLVQLSNGDARSLLNILQIALQISNKNKITIKNLEEASQNKQLYFDKKGEEFYNTISAFIKSMRASDTDAALYYLARMIEAGQDPLYIARRMIVFASEDIGLAQPTALVVANEVFSACERIGYPECSINLAHGTAYLCQAKKDRSAYDAYFSAVDKVKKHGNLQIPKKLRNITYLEKK